MASNKEKFTPTQRFWKLLKPDAKEIRNIYVYSIFNGLVALTLPVGIQAIINLIQGGEVSSAWIVLVFIVVFGIAITGILQIFQLRITENLQQKIFTRAAFEFVYRLPRYKLESVYRYYAPELMNRFFDVPIIQKGLSKILITFSSASLQVIFGLILLSLYHPFFIIFSIILIMIIFAIFRFTAKKGLQSSLDESKHKYKVAHWLEETARAFSTFKLAGKTDLHLKKVDDHVDEYLAARQTHFKVLVQQYSLMILFKVIVAAGLLAIGGILVMEQAMNIGQFVAAEIIIITVMMSVEKLILSLETIYDVLTSLEKVGMVTDFEIEENPGIDLELEVKDTSMEVELKDIWFKYPDSENPVIKGLNLLVKKGEHIDIVGGSGSGKSTLIQLIAGLYEVNSGIISYGGFPKDNIETDSLRTVMGGCLSGEQLFEGTLLENITVGRKNATFENVLWAIEKLELSDFVKSLPKGYNTIIDPLGKKFPQTIIQKLIMARSIVDKPKILLIEYAFENLEENERNRIVDFLTGKENDWTLIAVSSYSYLAQKSDRIAVMESGVIKHYDSYENLKSKNIL